MHNLLTQLLCMQAYKHPTTNAFVLDSVAKRHRNLLALLKLTKLPNPVFRLVNLQVVKRSLKAQKRSRHFS